MTTTGTLMAGKFADVGNSLITLVGSWAERSLPIVLTVIVVVTAARKFSVKAAVGALIGLALCMGLYASRDVLSDAFTDEINNPSKGSGVIERTVTDLPAPPPSGAAGTTGGVL
ncbi:hypothetical protein ABZ883_35345 [Streptomyces sp. NPDC046977]|uniref:hypothetical protein n=1 Tax=Streptomyces sp. NPDC046977 TaxID=3154703 RepID=UPI0033FD3749